MSKLRKQFISSNCRLRVTRQTAMYCKLAFAALAVLIGNDFVAGQEQIPSTTTAAELWNPWTWFWPYAIATAEGYRDYYQKAQKATNELYQQIYKTNAFPWVTGNWGQPQNNPGGNSQNGGNPQNNQNNQDNQDNKGEGNGQNNQNGGQDNPSQDNESNSPNEDNEQNNPGDDNAQNNPNDNQPNNDNKGQEEPSQDDTETDETNQNKPGAQVQGGAQGDGTADAQVNGKVQ